MPDSLQQPDSITVPARIGLVADTHCRSNGRPALPDSLLEGLRGCDLILHAGDLNTVEVLETLGKIAPVAGVHGNNDDPDVMRSLPGCRFFRAGSVRIGLLHGHGQRGNARQQAVAEMSGVVDCAIYGHSHMPDNTWEGGLLLVNPGSPTQRRRAPSRSYAIMTISDRDEIEVRHIELN